MSTARKPPTRYGLTTDPDQPSLVDAASLALGIMRAAKVGTWGELLDPQTGAITIPYEVVLTAPQLALLVEHQHLLTMVQRTMAARTDAEGAEISPATKLVTFAVCPECDRWILMSSGGAPARCTMTVNCPGAPVKAPAAGKQDGEPGPEADYLVTGEIVPPTVGSTRQPDIQPGSRVDAEADDAAPDDVQPATPEQIDVEPAPAASLEEPAAEPPPAYIPESTPTRGDDRELALVGASSGDPVPDDLEDFD